MGTPQGLPASPKAGPYNTGDMVNGKPVIVSPRDPTPEDIRNVAIGQVWVNYQTNTPWMLTSSLAGQATWTVLGGAAGAAPITKYVVAQDGSADYTTIQAAINAAHAAGGGAVWIRPGLYVENLVMYDAVDLYGSSAVSQNQGASVTIHGTVTPPSSGHIGFNSICFINETSVFVGSAAGTTHIVFLNCESAVQNGYFLDLPNWTGIFEVWDNNPSTAGAPWAVNDGAINNSTGGATLFIFSAGLGSGTNVCQLSGLIDAQNVGFGCPVTFNSGTTGTVDQGIFSGTVTYSGNSQVDMSQSRFSPASGSAIAYGTSAANALAGCIIDTATNPSISGSGAGNLQLTDVSFLNNSTVAGTLTTSNGVLVPSGGGSVPDPLTLVHTITTTTGDLVATLGNIDANGANIGPGTAQFTGPIQGNTSILINGGSPPATCQPINHMSVSEWPTVSVTTSGGGTYDLLTANAFYTFLGDAITLTFTIQVDILTGTGGTIRIAGFDTAVPQIANYYGTATVINTTFSTGTSLFSEIDVGNAFIVIGACKTGTTPYYLQDTDTVSGSILAGSITYGYSY